MYLRSLPQAGSPKKAGRGLSCHCCTPWAGVPGLARQFWGSTSSSVKCARGWTTGRVHCWRDPWDEMGTLGAVPDTQEVLKGDSSRPLFRLLCPHAFARAIPAALKAPLHVSLLVLPGPECAPPLGHLPSCPAQAQLTLLLGSPRTEFTPEPAPTQRDCSKPRVSTFLEGRKYIDF